MTIDVDLERKATKQIDNQYYTLRIQCFVEGYNEVHPVRLEPGSLDLKSITLLLETLRSYRQICFTEIIRKQYEWL